MLKIICVLMALVFALTILCSTNVESRIVHSNLEGIPLSHAHYLTFYKDQGTSESSNEDDQASFIHAKRKSELLSSLYSLPYALANKRNAN